MKVHHPPPDDLTVEPPAPPRSVLLVGLTGVGLCFLALAIGLVTGAPTRGFESHPADGPRALLALVGLLVAGCAASMRPGWFGGWLCLAGAGLLGYGLGSPWPPAGTEWQLAPPRDWFAGVPNSWDSVQLFFGVSAIAGGIGAAFTGLPPQARYVLVLCGVAFHFAGILSAVTSPPPSPWLSDQYWKRVARPYLQFFYLNNAYQFYSPDPGPACELWVCVEYRPLQPGEDPDAPVSKEEFEGLQQMSELQQGPDEAQAARECAWVMIPRRANDYVDPLGLSYYRRLSVTENVAQYQSVGGASTLAVEQQNILARRREAETFIPRAGWPDEQERRPPNELVTRQVLPSFARHLAWANRRPDRAVRSVKIYRALHLIASVPQFRGSDAPGKPKVPALEPYNPTLYLPYFQGTFARDGRLVNPTDPLLYWLVPTLPVRKDQPYPAGRAEYKKNGFDYYYIDYVSRHAGCPRPKE